MDSNNEDSDPIDQTLSVLQNELILNNLEIQDSLNRAYQRARLELEEEDRRETGNEDTSANETTLGVLNTHAENRREYTAHDILTSLFQDNDDNEQHDEMNQEIGDTDQVEIEIISENEEARSENENFVRMIEHAIGGENIIGDDEQNNENNLSDNSETSSDDYETVDSFNSEIYRNVTLINEERQVYRENIREYMIDPSDISDEHRTDIEDEELVPLTANRDGPRNNAPELTLRGNPQTRSQTLAARVLDGLESSNYSNQNNNQDNLTSRIEEIDQAIVYFNQQLNTLRASVNGANQAREGLHIEERQAINLDSNNVIRFEENSLSSTTDVVRNFIDSIRTSVDSLRPVPRPVNDIDVLLNRLSNITVNEESITNLVAPDHDELMPNMINGSQSAGQHQGPGFIERRTLGNHRRINRNTAFRRRLARNPNRSILNTSMGPRFSHNLNRRNEPMYTELPASESLFGMIADNNSRRIRSLPNHIPYMVLSNSSSTVIMPNQELEMDFSTFRERETLFAVKSGNFMFRDHLLIAPKLSYAMTTDDHRRQYFLERMAARSDSIQPNDPSFTRRYGRFGTICKVEVIGDDKKIRNLSINSKTVLKIKLTGIKIAKIEDVLIGKCKIHEPNINICYYGGEYLFFARISELGGTDFCASSLQAIKRPHAIIKKSKIHDQYFDKIRIEIINLLYKSMLIGLDDDLFKLGEVNSKFFERDPELCYNFTYLIIRLLPLSDLQKYYIVNNSDYIGKLIILLRIVKMISNCSDYLCNQCCLNRGINLDDALSVNNAFGNRSIRSTTCRPIFNIKNLVTIPNLQDKKSPIGCYVNPQGAVHDTITVCHNESIDYMIDLHGEQPITAHSWFPGYGWIIMGCTFCDSHLGWKFVKVDNKVEGPQTFFGFTRAAIVLDKSSMLQSLGCEDENLTQAVTNHADYVSGDHEVQIASNMDDFFNFAAIPKNLPFSCRGEDIKNNQKTSIQQKVNRSSYLNISEQDFKFLTFNSSNCFKNVENSEHWYKYCKEFHPLCSSMADDEKFWIMEWVYQKYKFGVDRIVYENSADTTRQQKYKSISDIDINFQLRSNSLYEEHTRVQSGIGYLARKRRRTKSVSTFDESFLKLIKEQANLPSKKVHSLVDILQSDYSESVLYNTVRRFKDISKERAVMFLRKIGSSNKRPTTTDFFKFYTKTHKLEMGFIDEIM